MKRYANVGTLYAARARAMRLTQTGRTPATACNGYKPRVATSRLIRPMLQHGAACLHAFTLSCVATALQPRCCSHRVGQWNASSAKYAE